MKLVLSGFLVALLSAGIGIGGGAMLVPILMAVFGFDFRSAANTSLATIAPISFVGSIGHLAYLPRMPDLQYYSVFIPSCVFLFMTACSYIVQGLCISVKRLCWSESR